MAPRGQRRITGQGWFWGQYSSRTWIIKIPYNFLFHINLERILQRENDIAKRKMVFDKNTL
jgi:hypothetical protein